MTRTSDAAPSLASPLSLIAPVLATLHSAFSRPYLAKHQVRRSVRVFTALARAVMAAASARDDTIAGEPTPGRRVLEPTGEWVMRQLALHSVCDLIHLELASALAHCCEIGCVPAERDISEAERALECAEGTVALWCEALVALAALIGTSRGTGAAESTSERFTVLVANLAIDVGAKLTRLEAASAAMDASQPWLRARVARTKGVALSVLDRSLSAALTCGQNVRLPLEVEPRRALAAALWTTQCVRPSAGQQSGDCRQSNQGIATTWGSLTSTHARHKWSALAALHRLSEPKGFDILQSPRTCEDDPSERSVGPLLEALSLNEPRDVLLPVLVCLRAVLPLHVLSKREEGAEAASSALESVLGPVEAALKTDRRCRQRRVVSALVACVYQPALLGEPIVMSPLQRFFDVLVECGRARRPHIVRALVARVVNVWSGCAAARNSLPRWASRLAPLLLYGEPFVSEEQRAGNERDSEEEDEDGGEFEDDDGGGALAEERAATRAAPAASPCLPGAVVRVTLLLFLESLPTSIADAPSAETFAVSRGARAPRALSPRAPPALPFTRPTLSRRRFGLCADTPLL